MATNGGANIMEGNKPMLELPVSPVDYKAEYERASKELTKAYAEIARLKTKMNTALSYISINAAILSKFAEGNSEK